MLTKGQRGLRKHRHAIPLIRYRADNVVRRVGHQFAMVTVGDTVRALPNLAGPFARRPVGRAARLAFVGALAPGRCNRDWHDADLR
jgi:hypothetical protein